MEEEMPIFRDTYHMGYTEIIDLGAFGETEIFRISTLTCFKAGRNSL